MREVGDFQKLINMASDEYLYGTMKYIPTEKLEFA